jgi:hypothetical protein
MTVDCVTIKYLVLNVDEMLEVVGTSHLVLLSVCNHLSHQAPKEVLYSLWDEPATVTQSTVVRNYCILFMFSGNVCDVSFLTRGKKLKGRESGFFQILFTDLS